MPHLDWMMLCQSRQDIKTLGDEVGGQRCQWGLVTLDGPVPCPEKHPMLPYVGALVEKC